MIVHLLLQNGWENKCVYCCTQLSFSKAAGNQKFDKLILRIAGQLWHAFVVPASLRASTPRRAACYHLHSVCHQSCGATSALEATKSRVGIPQHEFSQSCSSTGAYKGMNTCCSSAVEWIPTKLFLYLLLSFLPPCCWKNPHLRVEGL